MKFILLLSLVYSQTPTISEDTLTSQIIVTLTDISTSTSEPQVTTESSIIRTSTIQPTPTNVSNSPPSSPSSFSSLPLGTKLGIGAGILFGIVLILAIISYIYTKFNPEKEILGRKAISDKGSLTRPEYAIFTLWRNSFERRERERLNVVEDVGMGQVIPPNIIIPANVARRSREIMGRNDPMSHNSRLAPSFVGSGRDHDSFERIVNREPGGYEMDTYQEPHVQPLFVESTFYNAGNYKNSRAAYGPVAYPPPAQKQYSHEYSQQPQQGYLPTARPQPSFVAKPARFPEEMLRSPVLRSLQINPGSPNMGLAPQQLTTPQIQELAGLATPFIPGDTESITS